MIQKLSKTGISALVLFNRFYSIDFDVEKLVVTAANALSTPAEIATPLRWIALMANRVGCDLAASTGIHDGAAVVKGLLAGARAVQTASALYKNGAGAVRGMLAELENWMDRHGFKAIADFRGKMSQAASEDPAVYERVQFMKQYGASPLR
jgi:dihydroorotate dehydrogenase (fumarate)